MASLYRRFWDKVTVGDECWDWDASRHQQGYGLFGYRGHLERAHRMMWQLHHGEPALDFFVLHRCDNPSCVRPSHLFLGTHQDNMRDKVSKRRQTRGESVNTAKLTREQARTIRVDERPNPAIAKEFGITTSVVCGIKHGRVWRE